MTAPFSESPYKSLGGVRRIFNAFRYSVLGFKAALRCEAAFRQELALAVVMIPAAFFVGRSLIEIVMLIAVVVAVLVVELMNSAVEALADAISLDTHPLLGRAKDIGSAAVMLSLVFAGGVWAAVLISRFWV